MSKWLLRKTSGSRYRYKMSGDYSEHRNANVNAELDELPHHESMGNKKPHDTYLDTSLVKRWLSAQVGKKFDAVYAEFLTRIQPKYLDEYRDCIYWYVEKREHVEVKENGEVWGKNQGEPVLLPYSQQGVFYVDPESGVLCRLRG